MPTLNVHIRGARLDHHPALMEFYRATETDTLPPPSLQTLENSLWNGSLLVVEDTTKVGFMAACGYFEYIKSKNNNLIFELAGTRVTSGIGRLSPVPLQQILLAIRLFQILSTEEREEAISVISSACHPKSIANLQALAMAEISNMPKWLEYDTCSWTRMSERSKWRHFIAGGESMHRALDLLQQVDFVNGRFACNTTRKRDNGVVEHCDVIIHYSLPLRAAFPAALAACARNELVCNFSPLPPHWP